MNRTPTHRADAPPLTVAAVFKRRDRNRDRTPTHKGAWNGR